MTDALQTELRSIMSETFRIAVDDFPTAPTPDNTPGWDSLAHMELIEALEHRYGIEISHSESVTLLSEDEILAFLKARTIEISKIAD